MSKQFDVVVIGGGPGGYVAAIRAAQLGFAWLALPLLATLGTLMVRPTWWPAAQALPLPPLTAPQTPSQRNHLEP